jgi:hypothetical protein
MWKDRKFMFGSLEIESTAIAYRRLRNTGLFCFIIRYKVPRCFDVYSAALTFKL